MLRLCELIFTLLVLTRLLHYGLCENEYDAPISIKLFHNLEEGLRDQCWIPNAQITILNANTGNVNIQMLNWNSTTSEKLLALAKRHKLYRVKAVVLTSKGREIDFLTFVPANKLTVENVTVTLLVTLDYTGSVMAITLQTFATMSENVVTSLSPVVFPTVIIRATELGPVPDTASYIQKLEREREAKERGSSLDNRSFFAKYPKPDSRIMLPHPGIDCVIKVTAAKIIQHF